MGVRHEIGRSMLPRFASLGIVVLVTVVCGCSDSGSEVASGKAGAAKLVNQKDLYNADGKGSSKVNSAVSRKERVKLLREAASKSGSE